MFEQQGHIGRRDIRYKACRAHAYTGLNSKHLYAIQYIYIPLTARVMPAGVAPTGGVGVAGEGKEGAGPWSE